MIRRPPFPVLVIFLVVIGGIAMLPTMPRNTSPSTDTSSVSPRLAQSVLASNRTPLRSLTAVVSDPTSITDELAYIAAVPTGVFYAAGKQYVSPVLMVDGSRSESWLVDDWVEYLETDGGTTQFTVIGPSPSGDIDSIWARLGAQPFPWIQSASPYDVAAQLAVANWRHSDTAVVAVVESGFSPLVTTSDSSSFTLSDDPMTEIHPSVTVTSSDPVQVKFTPPTGTGWIQASFDWTGSAYFTHTLTDPNGVIVDYSVRSQTYQERFSSYVDHPVPLQFWVPCTAEGEWTLTLYPEVDISSPVPLDSTIVFHPGRSVTITVPANARSLEVSASWDNAATDINLALIDPTGHLSAWAPAGSVISNPGSESASVDFPMPGEWTLIAAWLNATGETNNGQFEWDITTIDGNLGTYMESAANGAVLASLLNAPLLYVTPSDVPDVTLWAIQRLGVSYLFLVDPSSMQTSSLLSTLSAEAFVTNLNNYPLVSHWIRVLSSTYDVVVTAPLGAGDELFAAAAYSGAVHGAPVFSLCGDDNLVTTRAAATWVPYLIGPEIDVYVTSRYTTRTENGWYDERIPNRYAMELSATTFKDFLDGRNAYNESEPQSVVILSPVDVIKPSFDRSLQSHFSPGRIPATTAALATVMVARAALHRFLFLIADSAEDALVTMYAYTQDAGFVDNNFNYYVVDQYENSTRIIQESGLTALSHIGVDEVFSAIASQVSLWTISTHGTLTRYPTDPPERPGGTGLFSLRDVDAPYGMETSSERDANGDHLVNPVLFDPEASHHVIKNTDDLEGAVDNIGSPIVIITACLLGGSRLPLMLMEHGAVGVVASPRTVYFQPAAMLSLFLMDRLREDAPIGQALSYAVRMVSIDYTDPLPSGDPRDYANQHILYGDPGVRLFAPSTDPHVPAVDANTLDISGHRPGRGLPLVAAVADNTTLPTLLEGQSVDHITYTSSNISALSPWMFLHRAVIIEPDYSAALAGSLQAMSVSLHEYVRGGGALVVMGVTPESTWIPWPVSYDGSQTGEIISIDDPGHPLVSLPNSIPESTPYAGVLTGLWENFTVVASTSDGQGAVMVAGVMGHGKIALMTLRPTGDALAALAQNVATWYVRPSIFLSSLSLSEYIIWGGDRVSVLIHLLDGEGRGVTGASIRASINSSDVSAYVSETGDGYYQILLDEGWTTAHPGVLTIRIEASKEGYDTLTAIIPGFMYIRPSPWLAIGIVGAVFAGIMVLYVYRKRKRGERVLPSLRRGKKSRHRPPREGKKRPEKAEKEEDLKEFFGV